MKTILMIMALLSFFCVNSLAQTDTTEYYQPKNNQDTIPVKIYDPATAGILSFVFPGLGQSYCDEKQRGRRFMAAMGGCVLIMTSGVWIAVAPGANYNSLIAGGIVLIGGLFTGIGIAVWSSIDAVKIANTKNNRAQSSHTSLRLQPNLLQHQQNLFTGLTLKLEF